MANLTRYIVIAAVVLGVSVSPMWAVQVQKVDATAKRASRTLTEVGIQLVVIVNPENELTHVSSKDLKKIFTGDTMYFGKRKISSYLTSDPKTSDAVLKRVYRLRNKRMLKKMWMKKLYRGIVFVQPSILSTRSEVIASVSKDPGGIAIVERDKLPKGVKLVKVDNKPFF